MTIFVTNKRKQTQSDEILFFMEMLKILVNKVFLIYDETSRSPLLLYVVESGGSKILV